MQVSKSGIYIRQANCLHKGHEDHRLCDEKPKTTGRRTLTHRLRRLAMAEDWNIGVVCHPIHEFLQPEVRLTVRWLPPLSRGRYLADPFGFHDGEHYHVLCEDFDYATCRGIIRHVEIADDGMPRMGEPAISVPCHTSYPYLVMDQGEWYCIPETYQAREVSLYRAESLPDRWTKVAVLLDNVVVVDSTVFRYGERWWLVCTEDVHAGDCNLLIWHATSLLGPWKPHDMFPAKTDPRSSRSAGTPFVHDGFLYRPAQDCSSTYGGRIVLNRVLKLSTTEFEEEPAVVIEADPSGPYPNGVHTISSVGAITLIDGKREYLSTGALRGIVADKIGHRKASRSSTAE